MKLRIFGLSNDSIVDGPGIRYSIFVQGCKHNCEGCHNPASHDINGGTEYDADEIVKNALSNPLIDGVTFSGGEPFLQAKPLAYIAKKIHEKGLNVVTYTGYVFERLIQGANGENGWKELLEQTDILIDGKFILEQRSIALTYKGSKNQRIIDVPASLKSGRLVRSKYDDGQ